MPESPAQKDERLRTKMKMELYWALASLRNSELDLRTIASQVKQTADLVLIELEEASQ
jgi:hypothetical protein